MFDYKVVPAPRSGMKAKGLKTGAERYARALEEALAEMSAEGWEFCRAETLPCEERQGLRGKSLVYHSVLIFRRATGAEAEAGQAAPAIFSAAGFGATAASTDDDIAALLDNEAVSEGDAPDRAPEADPEDRQRRDPPLSAPKRDL